MTHTYRTLRQGVAVIAVAATTITAIPLAADSVDDIGFLNFSPAFQAAAKDGDSGSDDNSGSGSDDSGRDSSGRGGDSNDGDDDGDHSGHGRGRGGDDDDGKGRGRGRGGDDDGRGRGRGGDDDMRGEHHRHHSRPRNLAEFFGIGGDRGAVVKAEMNAGEIEVIYADGWKEEIEHGRYELKNPANRTVVERPATQDDFDRLNSAF